MIFDVVDQIFKKIERRVVFGRSSMGWAGVGIRVKVRCLPQFLFSFSRLIIFESHVGQAKFPDLHAVSCIKPRTAVEVAPPCETLIF